MAARLAKTETPTYAVIGLGCLSTVLLLSALVNEKAFNYIIGIAALLFFFVYILQTIGLLIGYRRGHHPARRTRHLRPRPVAVAALRHRTGRVPRRRCRAAVPAAVHQQQVGVPRACVALAAAWWATGLRSRLRRGDAGSDFAKTHLN